MPNNYPYGTYFCNRSPDDDGKLVIHTAQCPYLAHEPDRFCIGASPNPSCVLNRAEKVFFPKSFSLCPVCCTEVIFHKKSK